VPDSWRGAVSVGELTLKRNRKREKGARRGIVLKLCFPEELITGTQRKVGVKNLFERKDDGIQT